MPNKLIPKVGVVRITWPKFKIWEPAITSERIKIRAPNFVQLHVTWSPLSAEPRADSGVVRIDPLRFLARCRTKRLINSKLSITSASDWLERLVSETSLSYLISLSVFLVHVVLLTKASFYVVSFYPCDAMRKRGLCCRKMSVCLSVSVCPSHAGIVSKRLNLS